MSATEDISGWADRIEHAIGAIEACPVSEVVVYQRVSSTQDAARRHFNGRGVVAVASEQTAGRGRRGRRWDDGIGATLPMSIAFETERSGIHLAARAGLAALDACADRLPNADVRIKWPNDIVVRSDAGDRKLAGVLIDRRGSIAVIGIGINASTIQAGDGYHPVSFHDLGVSADRCDLAIGVIDRLSAWLVADNEAVRARWSASDAMLGTVRAFEADNESVRGEVIALDPLSSIHVRTDSGEQRIDVATARNLG